MKTGDKSGSLKCLRESERIQKPARLHHVVKPKPLSFRLLTMEIRACAHTRPHHTHTHTARTHIYHTHTTQCTHTTTHARTAPHMHVHTHTHAYAHTYGDTFLYNHQNKRYLYYIQYPPIFSTLIFKKMLIVTHNLIL